MITRGTRIIEGNDAKLYSETIDVIKNYLLSKNYEEIIIPSIWSQDTFTNKAGPEILNQMYTFKDKGDRDLCLIPEVTAIIQELYKESWETNRKKPVRLFYVSRCYRYERPQAGRYREFTQFGVELLGGKNPDDRVELDSLLSDILNLFPKLEYNTNSSVKRGLSYYVEDGFEVECPKLGAQKQVCGGGRYDCGIGFAFGIDRLMLALKEEV